MIVSRKKGMIYMDNFENIIEEYKPYYKGTAKPWQEGMQGFWNEFKRFINI